MQVLLTKQIADVNISQPVEIVHFHNGDMPKYVVTTVALDGLGGAGGSYIARVLIGEGRDGQHIVMPDNPVTVAAGLTKILFQSRPVLLLPDSNLYLIVRGTDQDTSVKIISHIIDISPVTLEGIVDVVSPALVAAVIREIRDLDVIVRPETKVLGPIPRSVKQYLLPKNR